ncbi:protein ClpB [Seminavis robusta]|uniref:Protein ClpB n=1 Tax=Seminavis robusta TaxID=568900 RepID=A0A9N8HF27_9STRA|nr:protein ClpB [Seminavis robusta]|eukprot:Sro504_g156000.1 protein ClpB (959) ;mRNA; f:36242-39621
MTPRYMSLATAWLLAAAIGSNDFFVAAFSTSQLSRRVAPTAARSSFVGTGRQNLLGRPSLNNAAKNKRKTTSSHLSMVIDTLSDDCIAAVKESHDIGNEIGMTILTEEILLAGIVRHPERARKTLNKYNIDSDDVKTAAIEVLRYAPGDSLGTPPPPEERKPLPFSPESKLLLNRAFAIAESMESKVTRSEHVLLALMGYNNGRKIDASPIINVLQKIKSISRTDAGFKVFDFCDDLVNDLPMTPVEGGTTVKREAVVIGGGDGNTNTLAEVGVDMTQLAMEGKYDAVFGRNDEIRSVLRTLGRRRKNNPCLIGDPGVGKTAVAEALAQVLAAPLIEMEEAKNIKNMLPTLPQISLNPFARKEQEEAGQEPESIEEAMGYELPPCPACLVGARLINVELSSLVAGTSNRGDFEKKVKKLIEEASNNNVILFIDEIHNLVGTGGGGDGAMNAANLMKPALARGDLRVLGATTTPEYRRYIEKDGALERRFQPLEIQEPTEEETLDILAAIFPKYEEYHGVEYTSKALMAATKLSSRYITDRFLPDKAIDLLDEAGSSVKMVEEGENFYVTEDSITEVVSELTGIPMGKLDTGEKSRLQTLEAELEKRIKGQYPAVRSVSKSIRRARSGMRDMKRPVASFMFCGPTGVGKTELCKALAETYFGQEKDMIRIDMSEYMDRFSTSRLIGAPPGYVGYEEGGQLTEAVRRSPHSVILFDELEKAHEDVLNLLLQIMDEGTLTDGKGRKVNFKNNILVMTSNIGSKEIMEAAKGADNAAEEINLTSDIVQGALEEAMRPELLNRIDEIVVFNPLTYENMKAIAANLVKDAVKRADVEVSVRLQVSGDIPEIVTREALKSSSVYGARPVRRAVQRYVEDTMAEALVSGFVQEGDNVSLGLEKGDGEEHNVKITNLSSNGGGKSIVVSVDQDAGISADQSLAEQAAFGDLPPLDDEPPKKEPDAFQ